MVWKKSGSIHERTRKLLCQVIFLLAGVLPFFACCIWLGWTMLPWHQSMRRSAWEATLEKQIGLKVSLGHVEQLSPHQFVIHRLNIRHPETDDDVVQVRLVEGVLQEEGWAIRLAQPEVHGDQLQNCWRIVHDWFLCRPQSVKQVAKIAMNDLSVVGATARGFGSGTLKDLEIDLKASMHSDTMVVRYRHADDPPVDSIRLEFVRHHASTMPRTELRLETGRLSFPCDLISDQWPLLKQLGADASFHGSANFVLEENSWTSHVHGTVDRVHWNALTNDLAFRLTGHGRLGLNLELENGKIVKAQGEAFGKDGTVHRRWLAHSNAIFDSPAMAYQNESEMMYYRELQCRFRLTHEGLQIQGGIPLPEPNVQSAVYAQGTSGKAEPRYAMLTNVDSQPLLISPTRVLGLQEMVRWLSSTSSNEVNDARVSSVNLNEISQNISSRLPWSRQRSETSQGIRVSGIRPRREH